MALLALLALALLALPHAAGEPRVQPDFVDAFTALQRQVEQLSVTVAAQAARIAELERGRCADVASGTATGGASGSIAKRSEAPPAPLLCQCNAFNSTYVSVGDGEVRTDLVVGSPETGFVNNVNIAALDAAAVKNSGAQSIAGSLSVQSLSIGAWTLAATPTGLSLTSSTGGPGVTVLPEGGLELGNFQLVLDGAELHVNTVNPAALQVAFNSQGEYGAWIAGAKGAVVGANLQVSGTTALSGTATVGGHNVDPSTYSVHWCNCVLAQASVGGVANKFGGCGGDPAVDISCPANTFAVEVQANAANNNDNHWDWCGAGQGNGFQCCSVCVSYT